jgi:ribonuclease HII
MKRPRLTAFDRKYLGNEYTALIGVDEAGRGAFAGPVVAGAVWVRQEFYESPACRKIRRHVRDSKELTREEREEALAGLEKCRDEGGIVFAAGTGNVEEIAELNILGATRLAMRRALDRVMEQVGCPVEAWQEVSEGDLFFTDEMRRVREGRPLILVDGRPLKPFFYPHTALVQGDGRSFAIAAASIVAKVTRDRAMRELHEDYPLYGFDSNKGYGTPRHVEVIRQFGSCALHREKFLRNLTDGLAEVVGDELPFDVETGARLFNLNPAVDENP